MEEDTRVKEKQENNGLILYRVQPIKNQNMQNITVEHVYVLNRMFNGNSGLGKFLAFRLTNKLTNI